MRKYYFILCALSVCMISSAQNKKIETFDKNTWHWTEGIDKYGDVSFENGFMEIHYKKVPKLTRTQQQKWKKAMVLWAKHMPEFTKNDKIGAYDKSQKIFDEAGYGGTYISGYYFPEDFYSVKTFAKLPIRVRDDFKLTISYVQPSVSYSPIYGILFNANRDCLNNDDSQSECSSNRILISNTGFCITYQNSTEKMLKSGNFPAKLSKGTPMTLYIEKNNDKVIVELNGIEIFNENCKLTEAGFGFQLHNKGTLKIDEIVIEQAERNED